MELDLSQAVVESEITRNDTILFSESNTRFLVEVKPEHKIEFEAVMKDVPHGLLGKVRQEPCLKIIGLNNITIIEEDIYALKEAWQSPLRW